MTQMKSVGIPKEAVCQKCNGEGNYKGYGQCFSCRGAGQMAYYKNYEVTFLGIAYKAGDILPFTNTHSKTDNGKIINFWHTKEKPIQEGWKNINDIWYNLDVIRTGKKERYCLWRSILEIPHSN